MKSLSAFLKATIVGGAIYMVPIVVILAVLGKVHAVASKIVAPMTAELELHDIGGIHLARLLAIVALCSCASRRGCSPGPTSRGDSSGGLNTQFSRTSPAIAWFRLSAPMSGALARGNPA